MLNDILDDNISLNISFDSLNSRLSSLKENDEAIGNRDTYRGKDGIGIKSSNLQLTRNDSDDLDAILSSTNMVCNKNKDKKTGLSKFEEQLEENLENISSDGSTVSTSSTDAILRNSSDDDDFNADTTKD